MKKDTFNMVVETALSLGLVGRLAGYRQARGHKKIKTSRVTCSVPGDFALEVSEKLYRGRTIEVELAYERLVTEEQIG